MYQNILRPLLFLLPPEYVHRLASRALLLICAIPFLARLLKKQFQVADHKLEREVFGLRFPNPIGIAAGFDKEARLYNALSNFGFGHVEIGTVTPKGQQGNPKPRLFRLPKDKALVNRMGFNNKGVAEFVRNLKKNHPHVIIGGNIGKNTLTPNEDAVRDYCYCFSELFDFVDYFTVNISCPNIEDLNKLQNRQSMLELLHAIQRINKEKPKPKPVLLKISPDLSEAQLDEVIEIAEETELDGIVATNTTSLRANLKTDSQKIKRTGKGGLSGQPLRNKSTACIKYLYEKTGGKLPIIGAGGIFTADDALKKLKAGATLVQVYTGFVYEGPSMAKKINQAILNNN